MKFVHITAKFEYMDLIDNILNDNGIIDYARYPMIQGGGIDGRHLGSKIYPGNVTSFQAIVPDENVEDLLAALESFRMQTLPRRHLRAVVMPVEAVVGDV